jgi:ribosomal protein S27AE
MAVGPFGRTWTCDRCHLQQFVMLWSCRFNHVTFRYEADSSESSQVINSARSPDGWQTIYNRDKDGLPQESHYCPACSWVRQNEQDLLAEIAAGEDL